MKQLRVAVIYGGQNTEHEVSIVSANSIIKNTYPHKVLPIYISKSGEWCIKFPGENIKSRSYPVHQLAKDIDVAFPVLHGPMGEDGTIQGLLEILDIPYVGCGVQASAICMDKATQKIICKSANIPQAEFQILHTHHITKLVSTPTFPVFVKPSRQGSSIGVSRALNAKELEKAIGIAKKYDDKIIIERAVPEAREIEVAVLGNEDPSASILGEVFPSNDFYDYDAKYIDGLSTDMIPAKLSKTLSASIVETALKIYKLLECSGLARIDFLVEKGTDNVFLNEINTMPGFTSISMYPKLWNKSGMSFKSLVNKLLMLGIEKHQQKKKKSFSYTPKSDWYQA